MFLNATESLNFNEPYAQWQNPSHTYSGKHTGKTKESVTLKNYIINGPLVGV